MLFELPGNEASIRRESGHLVLIGSADVRRAILRSRLISQALSVEGIAVVVTSRAPERLSTEGVEVVLFASNQERKAA